MFLRERLPSIKTSENDGLTYSQPEMTSKLFLGDDMRSRNQRWNSPDMMDLLGGLWPRFFFVGEDVHLGSVRRPFCLLAHLIFMYRVILPLRFFPLAHQGGLSHIVGCRYLLFSYMHT